MDYIKEKKALLFDSYEGKLFQHRLNGFLAAMAAVLVALGVFLFFVVQWRSHVFTYYDVVSSVPREHVNGTEDIRLGNAVMTYSRDGAHCTDLRGSVLWNQTFEIQDPLIDVCQNVAAIADYNGRDVYVVSDSEILGNFATNMPIRNIAVSATGRVVVVMADTHVTYYKIFAPDGTELYTGEATMSSSGYPTALSLSPNGELMQISYTYLDAGAYKTNVAFYNLGAVGENKTDFFVGTYIYDLFVPYVQYMDEETSFAVSDSRLMIYKGSQIPVLLTEFLYTDEVKSVFYSEDYIGLVFYGDTGNSAYKMNVYDVSGKQVGTYYFDVEYTDIFFGKGYFAVYNDAECVIMTLNNVIKYSGAFDRSVSCLIPLNSSYRFLAVTDESIDTIQLR